ncbi:MAG: hypothetical protein LAT64_12685 [Phycisphaerales bacterium]|nr:hypothetical protein [Planctomycetota bacterium]MCH8509610.1 hypothetical protein [Phycisphaerales bacterium]
MDLITLGANNPSALIIIFGVGGGIAVVAIVFGTITKSYRHRQTEKSRREIAAYIAEGSMTPQDGERILKAGPVKDD